MAKEGGDAALVRGIAKDERVNRVSVLLIAEPSQDAESVWSGVHVIAENEKRRRLLANEWKRLRGRSSEFDFKADLGEVIAQALAPFEVTANDVGVNEA